MMFPNGNKAAIDKLIKRSLKANRSRNRYIVLAIVLTTWLIASVFSIGMSYVQSFDSQAQKMLGTKADAILASPTNEQLERLKGLADVAEIGVEIVVARWVPEEANEALAASFSWLDDAEWSRMKSPLWGPSANGYPDERNEVIVPTWILDELGLEEPQKGMTVPLTYSVRPPDGGEPIERTEPFTLSGWYIDYPHLMGRSGTIVVSQAFADEIRGGTGLGKDAAASVSFKNGKTVEAAIQRTEEALALDEKQPLEPVRGAASDPGDRGWTYAGMAGMSAFVMFSGYLLIFNVFYVSVSTDTKQYGLLKTIGATQRQIRRLVRGQANRLALIGIPLGLAAGAITSLVAVPMALATFTLETGVEISFHPAIFVGAALFAWLTTMAGSRKPARIAGRISPIEASKYVRASRKRGRGGAKLYRMALRNLFRDKKRAATVFLSLFLGMTTFLTVNTLVLSMDTDNFVDTYVGNDFEIENETFSFRYEGEPRPILTESLIRRIAELDGVTDVRATYVQRAYMPYSADVFGKYMDEMAAQRGFMRPSDEELSSNREGFAGFAVGLDTRDVQELNKELGTPIDLKRFEKGEIALLNTPDVEQGARVTLGVPGGSAEREFEIGGSVPDRYGIPFGGFAPNVYVSKQAMLKWLGEEPTAYRLAIQADEKRHSLIQEQLERLIADERELKLSSKLDWAEQLESAKIVFYILGGAVTLILAFIGILNFISTMLTSVIVRRQEFAVMESVGMTSKQLRKLLLWEGTGYAAISLLLVSTLGTTISYGAFVLFSQEADYAIYTFPVVPLLIAFALILAACWSVPLIAYGRFRTTSIVERLRETG